MLDATVTEVAPEPSGRGAMRVGWRLGGEPAMAALTRATMLEPGAVYEPDGAAAVRALPALAMWIRTPPDSGDWRADAGDAIGGLAGALELLTEGGVHLAFAIGAVRSFAPTAGRAARLWVGDESRPGDRLLPDYGELVRSAQQRLCAAGETLHPGEFLLAGISAPVRVDAGARLAVEIDDLDGLELELAP
jgi:hypothetical protein